jgi:hypothetical protein
MSTSMRVTRYLLFLFAGAAWLGMRVWGATPATAAVTTVLESSALRIEVTAAPIVCRHREVHWPGAASTGPDDVQGWD